MADIFDELNEDLRAERARALASRYGVSAGAVLVAVLLGVGGWQGWRWWQDHQAAGAALPYTEAMHDADTLPPGATPARLAAADAFAHVAATAPAGYRGLALLREASLRWDAGDTVGALALWDRASADDGTDRTLRDLASLLWAQHQLDAGDPALVAARVKPLQAPGNPWRPMAQEVDALLALRNGDKAGATKLLRGLAEDPNSAQGVRGRASGLLTLLGNTEARG